MKRFWNEVNAEPDGDEFRVLLDGKPINLPNGGLLRIGPPALARAVVEEWTLAGGAKGGEMSFADTPLTRLCGTARERIAPNPSPTADAIARYGETDLLCYRAESPEALVALQHRSWQPWLDWAALTFDAPLRVTTGIRHIKQHRGSVAALRRTVGAYNPYILAGLGIVVPALGSLVLGLALAEQCIDPGQAHALGALDELFQVEQWGEDDDAAVRRANVAVDIALAAQFMRLSA